MGKSGPLNVCWRVRTRLRTALGGSSFVLPDNYAPHIQLLKSMQIHARSSYSTNSSPIVRPNGLVPSRADATFLLPLTLFLRRSLQAAFSALQLTPTEGTPWTTPRHHPCWRGRTGYILGDNICYDSDVGCGLDISSGADWQQGWTTVMTRARELEDGRERRTVDFGGIGSIWKDLTLVRSVGFDVTDVSGHARAFHINFIYGLGFEQCQTNRTYKAGLRGAVESHFHSRSLARPFTPTGKYPVLQHIT